MNESLDFIGAQLLFFPLVSRKEKKKTSEFWYLLRANFVASQLFNWVQRGTTWYYRTL